MSHRPVRRTVAVLATALILGILAFVPALPPGASPATAASSTTPLTNLPVTDRSVSTMAVSGTTLYLGGDFSLVGPGTGSLPVVNPSNGNRITSFPTVIGETITAMARDSQGRIYIGGIFSRVGNLERTNLARLNADGTPDASFDFDQTFPPAAIAFSASVADTEQMYLAGRVNNPHGGGDPITDKSVLRVPVTSSTGALGDARLVAELTVSPFGITHIQPVGNNLVIAGSFSGGNVNGAARNRLASLTGATTSTAAGPAAVNGVWPQPNGTVRTMKLMPDGNLLIAGAFTEYGGAGGPTRMAIINSSTGANAGPLYNVPSFVLDVAVLPTANPAVHLIFTTSNTGSSATGGLRRYTSQSAPVDPAWTAGPGLTGTTGTQQPEKLFAGTADDGTTPMLYVTGWFKRAGVNDLVRDGAARVDPLTGNADAWDPRTGNQRVDAMLRSGGNILLGGQLVTINAATRYGLAAIDLTSGATLPFAPLPYGSDVYSLAVHGSHLYVGGSFDTASSLTRDGLARFDLATGAIDATWNPAPSPGTSVYSIAIAPGGHLWVGGDFSTMGGQARPRLARITSAGAVDLAFNANVTSGEVLALSLGPDSTELWVGGSFSGAGSVGGADRNYIAAVNPATGAVTSRFSLAADQPDGSVRAIAISPAGQAWVGGSFTMVGASAQPYIWRPAAAWAPNTMIDTVYAIGFDGTTMGLAVDTAENVLQDWQTTTNPGTRTFMPTFQRNINGGTNGYAIIVRGALRILGGSFNGASFQPVSGIAAFADPPVMTTTAASAVTGTTATVNGTATGQGLPVARSFRWGTDPALGTFATASIAGHGTSVTPEAMSTALSGLTPGTTYYFRTVGTSLAGTTLGTIQQFTTPAVTPTPGTSTIALPFAAKSLAGGW